MTDFKIDVVRVVDPKDFAAILPRWQSFVAEPEVTCGFWCDPEVIRASLGVTPGRELRLALVSQAQKLVAVLPFTYRKGPVPFRIGLRRVGAAHAHVMRLYDADFAIRKDGPRDTVLTAVLSHILQAGDVDITTVPNCPVGAAASPFPAGTAVRHRQVTYAIDMPESWDAYLGSMTAKTRQTLKRKVRKFSDATDGDFNVHSVREADDVKELHSALMYVWEKSWHRKLGRQKPPSVEFLSTAAGHGWLRSFVLYAGAHPVASVLGFQYRGVFLDEAPAYDAEWADLSPGLVLNFLLLKELFGADTPHTVDYGFGYNQYKEMLGTRPAPRGELWIPMSLRGRMLVSGLRTCDACFAAGKRVLGRTGVRRIKRRIQGASWC